MCGLCNSTVEQTKRQPAERAPTIRKPPRKVVACYIGSWAETRIGRGKYTIENFDPNLCTHAIYAFAGLDIENAAIKSLDPWQDLTDGGGKGGYKRLTDMKRSHPHLKVTLAIGGAKEGSENYSALAAKPDKRRRFVKQASEFLREHNFDGLDIDWEYPTKEGGKSYDRENFVALIKELREKFDQHQLLLTAAIAASNQTIAEAYDTKQLSLYLDYFHVMCYDYAGSWDKRIGFNAPLGASSGKASVHNTICYLRELGVPKQKLVLGLPFYGRTFTTIRQGAIGEDIVGDFKGEYTNENGFMGYNEICEEIIKKPSKWNIEWDEFAAQAIARSTRDPATGQMRVITYDDVRSVESKTRYAVERGLAGVMIWSVDTDDFLGESGVKYQLLRKANDTLSKFA